jgi:acetyl-CoA carboxylase biotin carboxyl carrier protein
MKLTNADVKDILDLLDATSFDVFHLETERFKLTLRRNRGGEWSQESQVTAAPNVLNAVGAEPASASVSAAPHLTEEAEVAGTIPVRATLPGTFYRAPRPGADAFVEIGSPVQKDTVIGIIETMKLMTAIHAGVRGTIAEVFIKNAQFAEQGAVLMSITPETL